MKFAWRYLALTLTLLAFTAPAFSASTSTYPNREVRIIVPWGPGGSNDIMARHAQPIMEKLGFKYVIENIPGGSSAVGLGQVATSEPDGYTLGWASSSILAVIADEKVPLALDDFTYISKSSEDPVLLLVHKDDPRNTIKKFMDYVKAHPGEVSVGAAGSRSTADLLVAMAAASAGTTVRTVPYNAGSRVAAELLGRQIDAAAIKPSESAQLRDSGDIIPLGFLTRVKSPELTHLPSFIEEGYNTYLHGPLLQMSFIVAPKGLPEDLQKYLIEIFDKCFASPEYQKVAKEQGFISELNSGEGLKQQAEMVEKAFKVVLDKVPVQ